MTHQKKQYFTRSPHPISPGGFLSQIDGLENGTEYYVRVAAYNGPGGGNATSESEEAFTTYGAPADAFPFPITTMEQVRSTHIKNPFAFNSSTAQAMALSKAGKSGATRAVHPSVVLSHPDVCTGTCLDAGVRAMQQGGPSIKTRRIPYVTPYLNQFSNVHSPLCSPSQPICVVTFVFLRPPRYGIRVGPLQAQQCHGKSFDVVIRVSGFAGSSPGPPGLELEPPVP